MLKRILATLAAIVFLVNICPSAATASGCSNSRIDEIAYQTLLAQHSQLKSIQAAEDMAGLKALTLNVLDRLIGIADAESYDELPAVLEDYSQDVERIQAQQLDPGCALPMVIGSTFATISIIQTAQKCICEGCKLINISNSIADITSDILSYSICVEENAATPDAAAIAALQSQQSAVEAFDFLTQALNLAYCNDADTTGSDLISLLFAFLDIFPDEG